MELECVESLGPDTLPPTASPPHDSRNSPNPGPSPTSPLESQSQPQPANSPDIINFPDNFLPLLHPITHASSPLTRSPSPSPKRQRITYHPTSPPPRPEASAFLPTSHPLARLCTRDRRYVVGKANHLADTFVTPTMREEVVAWCGDMIADLNLPEGIVAIATNLFDRFVARQPVSKAVLYALTASCLLLACKLTLDDDIPHDIISSRSGVAVDHIHLMEGVVLNVLKWDVNVVTPHEVVHELDTHLSGDVTDRQQALQESLMLNALLDYSLAGMRATSVGVACYIISTNVTAGSADADHTANHVYDLAARCGVNLAEVDFCVARLHVGMDMLFDEFEGVNSDNEDDD